MKKIWKTLLLVFSLLTIFVIPVCAEETEKTTNDELEIVDFNVSNVQDKYYELGGYRETKDELANMIKIEGAKCMISYKFGGETYELNFTLKDDYIGLDGIWWSIALDEEQGNLPGAVNVAQEYIKVSWEKVVKKVDDGETYYGVEATKDNALIFSFCGKTVRVPVNCNPESPVSSIKIVSDSFKNGIYAYQYFKMNDSLKDLLAYASEPLKIQVTFNDGTPTKTITWKPAYYDSKEIDGHTMSFGIEASGDGEPGVDFKKVYLSVSYMKASTKIDITIKKTPVKKITVTKAPKKDAYKLSADKADLYGAKLKIEYTDGTTKKVTVNTHKAVIPVNNKYKESIYLSYDGADGISIEYMGKSTLYKVKIKTSALGKAVSTKTGTKKLTLTSKKMKQLIKFKPTKTAKYNVSILGKEIRLVASSKGKKPTRDLKNEEDAKLYVINSSGKLMGVSSVEDKSVSYKFSKGKTYYFYIVTDSELYRINDNGKARSKVEITIGIKKAKK